MSERRVNVWGDIVGRFVVVHDGPDGRLVLEPDRTPATEHSMSQIAIIEQAATQGPAALDALVASADPQSELWMALNLVAERNEEVALSIYRVLVQPGFRDQGAP